MKLSKSKYCLGFQCKKILWLNKNKPEERQEIDNEAVLENGTNVGELAKQLLGEHVDVEFSENLSEMIKSTKECIDRHDNITITEASFDYDDNFCSVDLLKKNGNKYEIYEVKSSTSVKDIYREDASYQYYVLRSLGYDVTRVCVVTLDSSYERGEELDLHKLFKINDITEYAQERFTTIGKDIAQIKEEGDQEEELQTPISEHCFKPYECPFFQYCLGLKEKNVFDLRRVNIKKKFELYNQGFRTFSELMSSSLSNKLKMQIDFILNNRPDLINYDKIDEFLSSLTLPLYFLDFETFQQSVPLFKETHPYEQIPFQYSLHFYTENKELAHKEFLAEADIDPRRSLAESLVRDIPRDVCVVAYNMSFERTVIKNLARLYPDLREHLLSIESNIKDLMKPFYNYDYYSKDMQGSYSIKYVLPALYPNDPSLNYHNLEQVHNGSEAMATYASLGQYSKEEQQIIRRNLLEYCKLDTYAMVKIYDRLIEIQRNRPNVRNRHHC